MATIIKDYAHMIKGVLKYPSIVVDDDYPELLPVILGAMSAGELPVLVSDGKGKMIELAMRVSQSPFELEKILRLYPIVILVSPQVEVSVKDIHELLDKGGPLWTD